MKTIIDTKKKSEKLVNAINSGKNTVAHEILSDILIAKVDARFDEVIKKND